MEHATREIAPGIVETTPIPTNYDVMSPDFFEVTEKELEDAKFSFKELKNSNDEKVLKHFSDRLGTEVTSYKLAHLPKRMKRATNDSSYLVILYTTYSIFAKRHANSQNLMIN